VETGGTVIKFVTGVFGIFGHGVVVGLGEARPRGGTASGFIRQKTNRGRAMRPWATPNRTTVCG
jgi:3D-(3,5/4)-trihydroxycyclohexane-1,2-dione acylhydrolase (decyclizing)